MMSLDPRILNKICVVCKKPFTTKTANKKKCSVECRAAFDTQRKEKAKKNAR